MLRRSHFFAYLLLILAVFSVSAQPQPVARVAVSVGEARKVNASGQAELLHVGAQLRPGDRVRTGPDAVAILVFADEGRISLRADSELWIRHYELDPSGVRTRIELELVRGTVRQISGNASRAQPDRYRLNTPIAVIGVRGTDFLAKATADAVEAFVHEGQIVLIPGAPGATSCLDASTSACQTVALASSSSGLRYLRLTSSGQIENREFRPGELERVFGIETARVGRTPGGVQAAGFGSEFKLPSGTQFVTDTIFVAHGTESARIPQWSAPAHDTASAATNTTPAASAVDAPLPRSEGSTSQTMTVGTPGVGSVASGSSSETGPSSAPVLPPVASPSTPQPAAVTSELPTQLVWGRFSSASALPVVMTLPYADARQGRHVTVGELGEYALWRANPSGALDPSLRGKADFALAGAQAVLVQPSGVSAALVTAATLAVDFDLFTFSASVNLHHESAGSAALAVNGRVNEEGVFVGTNATDRVAGAVTLNGKEAGYLFSKDVSTGTFRGITLWGRK